MKGEDTTIPAFLKLSSRRVKKGFQPKHSVALVFTCRKMCCGMTTCYTSFAVRKSFF